MSNWGEAVIFGFALVAFVLGLSSIIMGFIHKPADAETLLQQRVEYGFFGVTGLVLFILFSYAL